MIPTYTDTQKVPLESHAKCLRQAAMEIRREGHHGWGNTCEYAAESIEHFLTERQAGSSGDVQRYTLQYRPDWPYNQAMMAPAKDGVYVKWGDLKVAAQPPTKESVRGVSDADVEAACLAYDNATSEVADYPMEEGIRAALESFANRGEGDE